MINWNKYQSKKANQAQNRYLDFSVDLSFEGVNRLFVWSFESYKKYYLPTIKITMLWSMEEIFLIK